MALDFDRSIAVSPPSTGLLQSGPRPCRKYRRVAPITPALHFDTYTISQSAEKATVRTYQ